MVPSTLVEIEALPSTGWDVARWQSPTAGEHGGVAARRDGREGRACAPSSRVSAITCIRRSRIWPSDRGPAVAVPATADSESPDYPWPNKAVPARSSYARSRGPTGSRYLRDYLSPQYRDDLGAGCPSATLLDEIGRCSGATKDTYTGCARSIVDEIAGRLAPGRSAARTREGPRVLHDGDGDDAVVACRVGSEARRRGPRAGHPERSGVPCLNGWTPRDFASCRLGGRDPLSPFAMGRRMAERSCVCSSPERRPARRADCCAAAQRNVPVRRARRSVPRNAC